MKEFAILAACSLVWMGCGSGSDGSRNGARCADAVEGFNYAPEYSPCFHHGDTVFETEGVNQDLDVINATDDYYNVSAISEGGWPLGSSVSFPRQASTFRGANAGMRTIWLFCRYPTRPTSDMVNRMSCDPYTGIMH